ncbi:MAG TPA: protein-glutamine glutaminase family protein [Polyangium sp.]|nr:protein-glutamine glutaminase family protein [Polyangium sp.]
MGRKAARVDDNHVCPLNGTPPAFTPPPPHVGGPILPLGAENVLFNGHHAARVTDKAECAKKAVPDDTIRGGLMTFFIEGNPAARIYDKTDVGSIVEGSPNIELGEWAGGALTPEQAQWLYDYLKQQKEIPFEYATDGCFARADRMADYIGALGASVDKQWVRATTASGSLHVPISNYPGGGPTWGWHVAPVVQVIQPGGAVQPMVLDPSLGLAGPVSVGDWIAPQTTNPGAVVTGSTSKDVYFRGWNSRTESWNDASNTMRTPERTASDLNDYRQLRANLPSSSGRNVPNVPVHY